MLYLIINYAPMVETPELVKKYYKPPYKIMGSYVFDSDDHMCLMFNWKVNIVGKEKLIDLMNGDFSNPIKKESGNFSFNKGEIFVIKENPIVIIRGWGRLQYIKEDRPDVIQDEFGKWILDLMNFTDGK